MNFATISTWKTAEAGTDLALEKLKNNGTSSDVICGIIQNVEDNPKFLSVGYGALPNYDGIMEFDSAFMDGDTLNYGAIAGVRNIKNPILVSRELSFEKFNNLLVGEGAEIYAKSKNFEFKNMLTDKAYDIWLRQKECLANEDLVSYNGHDTIGSIVLDKQNTIVAATSTSGLFMKKHGRVGDTPLCGCGLYADSSIGAATATGVGEELTKGVLSFHIVRKMEEGMHPMEAAEYVLHKFCNNLKSKGHNPRAMSVIAMDKQGRWGVSTNVEFSFVVAVNKLKSDVYIANMYDDNDQIIDSNKVVDFNNVKTKYFVPTQEWLNKNKDNHQFV